MTKKKMVSHWCKSCEYNPAQVEQCGIRIYQFRNLLAEECPREKALKKEKRVKK